MKKLIYMLDNEQQAIFNEERFRCALAKEKNRRRKNGDKCSDQKLLEDLSNAVGASISTIKHWSAGRHAPVDLEKVADLAKALNVNTNYLLTIENEMEDSKEMTNMITNNNIDFSSTKNTVRSIYSQMSTYIELFRMTMASDSPVDPLKPLFISLYTSLMKLRFDLPHDVFQKLCSFTVNYLQQMGCLLKFEEFLQTEDISHDQYGYDDLIGDIESLGGYYISYSNAYSCPPCAPWSDFLYVSVDTESEECKKFIKAATEEYECYNKLSTIHNEILINTAYSMIENILEEYLVK